MNKYSLFSVAFLGVMCWSCGDDLIPEKEPEEVLPPTVALTLPESGAAFDLSATQNISFTWNNDERISDCVLAFSRTSDMANPQTIAVADGQYTFTDSALNELLTTMYLSTSAQATLYWSVYPAAEDTAFVRQVRHLYLTPWPSIRLTKPDSYARISLGEGQIVFVWQRLEGITNYTLQLSKSADMSAPLNIKSEAQLNVIFVTPDEMKARLNELGLTGNPAEVYWSIVPANANEDVHINKQVKILQIDKTVKFDRDTWTATGSTTNSAFPPTALFDGSTGSHWADSSPAYPAWAIVDMHSVHTVTKISVFNRCNVKKMSYSVSVDGVNYTPAGEMSFTSDPNVRKTLTLAQPTSARYIRLDVTECYSGWVALNGLEVYGLE